MRTRPSVSRRTVLRGGLALAGGATLAGCSSGSDAERESGIVRYQGWAGEITYPELAAELGLLGDLRLDWIGNTISGPQDVQATVTGDVDIGGAFNGAIIRLVAAGAPISAVMGYYGADARTFCGFYTVADSDIRGPQDFIGKIVGVNTLGAHHEDVLAIYLRRGGLSEDEIRSVRLVVVPPVSAEQALRSGQLDVAALSEVKREKAVAHGGLRPVFTDLELLGPFTAGCYVVRRDFLEKRPDTARTLLEGTARAVRWAQTAPRDEVVARFAEMIRRRKRNEDLTTIQYWRSTGIAGPGGVIAPREFDMWTRRLVGNGSVKPERLGSLYTNEFNPFSSRHDPH